jgi:hypothetical protein
MTRSVLALLTVMLCGEIAAAQARPDFSGRWSVAVADAAAVRGGPGGRGAGGGRGARGDMGSGWGSVITFSQTEALLTLEYAFFTRGDMQAPLRFTYALDGSETKHQLMMGRGMETQTSRTAWKGDTLVITTTHMFPNPADGARVPVDVARSLVLQSADTLKVVTTRDGVLGGPSTSTETLYARMPEQAGRGGRGRGGRGG